MRAGRVPTVAEEMPWAESENQRGPAEAERLEGVRGNPAQWRRNGLGVSGTARRLAARPQGREKAEAGPAAAFPHAASLGRTESDQESIRFQEEFVFIFLTASS